MSRFLQFKKLLFAKFMPEKIKQNRKQSIASCIVVATLVVVAIAIGFKQNYFTQFDTDSTNITTKTEKAAFLTDSLFGEGFVPAGGIENYNSDNLYEKIDGKADLYLNNGFVSLQTRRFAENSSSENWAEV